MNDTMVAACVELDTEGSALYIVRGEKCVYTPRGAVYSFLTGPWDGGKAKVAVRDTGNRRFAIRGEVSPIGFPWMQDLLASQKPAPLKVGLFLGGGHSQLSRIIIEGDTCVYTEGGDVALRGIAPWDGSPKDINDDDWTDGGYIFQWYTSRHMHPWLNCKVGELEIKLGRAIANVPPVVPQVPVPLPLPEVATTGAGSPPPANPKQLYGDKKVPMSIVPTSFIAHTAVALTEGLLKYGAWNYRAAPVEAMTYAHAVKRHIDKWINGEECDPESKVHHLANAAACIAILLDTKIQGTLIDNRPPAQDLNGLFKTLEETLAHLKELHKDAKPTHYTNKQGN